MLLHWHNFVNYYLKLEIMDLTHPVAYQIPFFDLNGSKSVPVAPVNIKKLPATLEKDSVREKLIWGPFKVKAANVLTPSPSSLQN